MQSINVTNVKVKNADSISEDNLENNEETSFLSSIPGFVEDINEIRKNENWESAKEFNPDEEW